MHRHGRRRFVNGTFRGGLKGKIAPIAMPTLAIGAFLFGSKLHNKIINKKSPLVRRAFLDTDLKVSSSYRTAFYVDGAVSGLSTEGHHRS